MKNRHSAMKPSRLVILVLMLVLGVWGSGWGATYYINGSGATYTWTLGPGASTVGAIGNDNAPGDGSAAHPWATLNKCVSSGSANDTCYANGTFNEAWVDSKGMAWIADGTVLVNAQNAQCVNTSAGVFSVTGFTLDGGGTVADYGALISAGTGARAFTNVTVQNLKTSGRGLYHNAAAPTTWTGGAITGTNVLLAAFYHGGAEALTVSGTAITANSQKILHNNDVAGTETFTNITATMTLSGVAPRAFDITGKGNFVLHGGTYTIGGMQNFIRLNYGAGYTGTVTIDSNLTLNPSASATTGPIVYIATGAHPVDLGSFTVSEVHANQAQDVIAILDQPTPQVHNFTIDTTATTNTVRHVYIYSTGATVGASKVYNGVSRSMSTLGQVILVGNDTTTAGDAKNDAAEIYGNTIYCGLYYNRALGSYGLHGIEYGWSTGGKVHHNYVNGCSPAIGMKGGGQDYSGAGGVYDNLLVDNGGTGATVAQEAIGIKGIINVPVFNNTVYLSPTYRNQYGLIRVFKNADAGENHVASAALTNNLFVGPTETASIYVGTAGDDGSTITAANNGYYTTNAGTFNAVVGATTYNSWANWRAAGYDATTGFFANPLLNSNFTVQPGSPARGAGACPASGTWTDYDGHSTCTDGSYVGKDVLGLSAGAYDFFFGSPSLGGWPVGGGMMLRNVGR